MLFATWMTAKRATEGYDLDGYKNLKETVRNSKMKGLRFRVDEQVK